MKLQITKRGLWMTAILLTGISALSAQTGENPTPTKTPQKTNPAPPPPPPPPVLRPVFIPPVQPPVYTPQGNNPQNIPGIQKTPEQIARENRDMALNHVVQEMLKLSAETQTFSIKDVSKPFDFTGAKGFKIQFPEFAFVDDEGNPVLGEVTVNLTEYTSLSEFAAAGLTTMTTDGEILETGGMVNLEAKSGDKKLQLGKGKEVSITVPDVDQSKGFQVFYGSGSEQVKWSTTFNQNQNSDSEDQPFDGYTIKMLKPAGFAYGDKYNMAFYKNDEAVETYVNSKLKIPADVKKKILKVGIPFVYTIEFNALGKVKSVLPKNRELTDKSLISPVQNQIISILKDAPAFAMTEGGLVSGKPYDLIFATAKNYTGTVKTPAVPLAFPQIQKAANENNPSERNVNEFTMKSSGLTKINCDRFSGLNSHDTASFHFNRADALVYVVLKDMRSFITPNGANGNYSISKIPANTNVRYVAVVYDDQGGVHISSKDATFKQGEVTFDNAIPFSAENLKTALEAP